jgi:hypothetical protein
MSREKWKEVVDAFAEDRHFPYMLAAYPSAISWADSRIKELEEAVEWACMQEWVEIDCNGKEVNRHLKLTRDELRRRAKLD